MFSQKDTEKPKGRKESRKMTGIADVHSHILPGLDDGAPTGKVSVEMLRAASAQGIRRVIATPHYSFQFRNADPRRIRGLCRGLNRKAVKEEIPCRVYPGQEIMYSEKALELLERGEILTMAGSRYILVEFDPSAPYSFIYMAIRKCATEGYLPIVAHVERYRSVHGPGKAQELISQGAYLQMNYQRIAGKWNDDTARWCRSMLKKEQIHFLGTDMHNMTSRTPEIARPLKWIERHLQAEYAEKILWKNAMKILADEKIL